MEEELQDQIIDDSKEEVLGNFHIEEDAAKQGTSTHDKLEKKKKNKVDYILPYQWKKGQSGNPSGKKKGKTMKEYARELLECQTEEERQEFLHGLPKEVIWKMAEGNPETKASVKIEKEIPFTEEELEIAKQAIEKRLSDTASKTSVGETV